MSLKKWKENEHHSLHLETCVGFIGRDEKIGVSSAKKSSITTQNFKICLKRVFFFIISGKVRNCRIVWIAKLVSLGYDREYNFEQTN